MEEKTYVEDIDRSLYDFRNEDKDAYRISEGLTREIVEQISREKHDPEWMREFRLKSLEIYNSIQMPQWGPSIEGLNMENIVTYVRPNTKMQGKWEDVPEDIKDTFERLGIPQAEQTSLAGVGAQYDSELVYRQTISLRRCMVRSGPAAPSSMCQRESAWRFRCNPTSA